MIEAVFISDLHLHPQDLAIQARFEYFIQWALQHVRRVYILGDFFHVWAGDDALDDWSRGIAEQLALLHANGIEVYLMVGNRDFLIGKAFAQLASVTLLQEPTVIELGDNKVLLVHGDAYCTADKSHQFLRRLTRNALFPALFLRLSLKCRQKIVFFMRKKSQLRHPKPKAQMSIVVASMLEHLQAMQVQNVIHGHIHQPGANTYTVQGVQYQQYVLSDWDDKPILMCYDKSKGFYFEHLFAGVIENGTQSS
jgi:UDP-2,3-diacylglucosamine hydrolase